MSIYHGYFTAIQNDVTYNVSPSYAGNTGIAYMFPMHGKNLQTVYADFIKRSKGDYFIYIVTINQKAAFDGWVKRNGLEEYIHRELKQPITNGNHNDQGRRLWLTVFKSKE